MRTIILLLLIAGVVLPDPGLAQDVSERQFVRHLKEMNEACMLGARDWREEVHEPLLRSFCDGLLAALEDKALSREETEKLAGEYATLLDRLHLRQVRNAHKPLKKALLRIPVPDPTIEDLLTRTDAHLLELKAERARNTTPEGLLEQYGDKSRLNRDLDLFKRERAAGYGSSRTKEVEHLLDQYDQRPLEALPDTGETKLDKWNRKRVIENIFQH